MIQPERVKTLNQHTAGSGEYVLYWMQASQRVKFNHALEYAIREANALHKPLVVYFGLDENYPEANQRHFKFMLEGLREVKARLRKKGIRLVLRRENPAKGVIRLGEKACSVITDRGYQRHQRNWREEAASGLSCPFAQVETDAVVPLEAASRKREYAAATFRPRINRVLENYLVPLRETAAETSSLKLDIPGENLEEADKLLSELKIDRSVPAVDIQGGEERAERALAVFIKEKLNGYPAGKNDPGLDFLSGLSPYLHFGQISPLEIALRVLKLESSGREAFLEELIVRRELSFNFTFYDSNYDSIICLPPWAVKTLEKHGRDIREYIYSAKELEEARTHDSYWNSAQREMLNTGKMHGYMRMYWGKKILEWVPDLAEAFSLALYLNNKYEIDGRDPNGYAGVAWCFGNHDRAFAERPVFGKVRYMSAAGLKRKFNMAGYVSRFSSQALPAPRPRRRNRHRTQGGE